MSNRYKGAVISATPPTTSGGPSGTASGAWTLEQQLQLQAAGLWPSQPPPPFIEDVFSTYLYTGTGNGTATPGTIATITNGIDLSTKGGLVWMKNRTQAVDHNLYDTTRGALNGLQSNGTSGQSLYTNTLTAFTTSGFSLGNDSSVTANYSGNLYASWTFREQPKFFDVVTYTGNGTAGRQIAHSLGSVPGCIIVKQLGGGSTGGVNNWFVYHRSLGGTKYLGLDGTFAAVTSSSPWNNTDPTSTVFTIGGTSDCNDTGGTYVAYLFAHDAGGFGLTETDNVISCGTFTTDGSGDASVNLGYEPQWVMQKRTDSSTGGNWFIADNMRGMTVDGSLGLFPNLSSVEDTSLQGPVRTNATGFTASRFANATYIYIAIRRGPMKVPTVGTSVFEPVAYTGTGTNNRIITSSITPDSVIPAQRNDTASKYWYDRLRGNGTYLITTGTNAEGTDGAVYGPQFNKVQTGYQQGTSDSGFLNSSTLPTTYINYLLKRAPSFFDEVCYTGTGVARTVAHNLTVVPELMIVKVRNDAQVWQVYSATTGNAARLQLNTNDSVFTVSAIWNTTTPTSSVFSIGTNQSVNGLGSTYVAYLFATCAGVSKVGSYTGNAGYTVTVPCGFTAGVRFVLIKRTDSTGDWYVWDSARGIVAGNDPYLLLNSTAAEVTGTDYVDTYAAGFEVTSTAPAGLNATGGTYIFLAIA